MKVLVVGSGGREHALGWGLAQGGAKVIFALGNPGTDTIGNRFPVEADDIPGLLKLAKEEQVDYTLVGPEVSISLAIADAFLSEGQRIVAPTQAAGILETSKAFAKEFMRENRIPTAEFEIFYDYMQALRYIEDYDGPLVIKADGLCGGKGVIVTDNADDAALAVYQIMVEKRFGAAGNVVVIEKKLVGWECSFTVFTDGIQVLPLAPVIDSKRRFEDTYEGINPNTGSMGSYCPNVLLTSRLYTRIMDEIVYPTIEGMVHRGTPYTGILYFGLMIVDSRPFVIEYNVRMGDTETQAIIVRLQSNLAEVFNEVAHGELSIKELNWMNFPSVALSLVGKSYPDGQSNGEIITGIEEAERLGAIVFHAGTAINDAGKLITKGGRVLTVTGAGPKAREIAYLGAACINFADKALRFDIAPGVR